MKRSVFFVVAASLAGGAGLWAQGQPGKKEAIFVSTDKAVFKPLMPGAMSTTAWGDPDKGPHGTFTRFVPGFDAGVHSHTNDTTLVVIKGAYLYKADGKEIRVGPGDFLFVPGGTRHWSGGDAKEGALFYEHGVAKFDVVPVK